MKSGGRIVLLTLIVAFAPAVSSRVVPSHDALQVYTAFWTYISALITEGRLPEWIPFGRYGTPAAPTLMYVTPVAYLTGVFGALLHRLAGFKDTLLLFKLTVFLEYVLFAAGALRVGMLLFRSQWVRVTVAALGIFSSPWILSLDGNFHAFYLTPWILCELTLAMQTAQPKHLGYAALLAVFSCVGNVPYYPPFLLLQLFVFAIPLVWAYWRNLKPLLLSWQCWVWIGLAAAVAAIHFLALIKGMQGLAIFSPGRDPVTNHVPLGVFLTYAGNTQPLSLLWEFVGGHTTNGDNTFYMGLATLGLFPLSFFLARPSPALRALQTLALFVLLFSTGGIAATLGYYFPGMVFYRHVSIVFGLFRILAFFCAGFVLDAVLERGGDAFADWRARTAAAMKRPFVWLIAAVIVFDLVRAQLRDQPLQLAMMYFTPEVDPAYLRLTVYLAALWLAGRPRTRHLWPALLIGALVIDLMVFWAAGWIRWPRLDGAQAATMASLAAPRPVRDPGPRFTEDVAARRAPMIRFLYRTEPLHLPTTALYVHTYFWTGEDPCVPRFRTDFLSMPVAQFFARRGIPFTPSRETERRVLRDPVAAAALACGRPRISSPAKVRTFTRGYDWLQMSIDNPYSKPVFVSVSEAAHEGWAVQVDGARAPMAPAYGAFLGASVPPGRHDVRFRFHLPVAATLRAAEAWLAGLGAAVLLLVSFRDLVRKSEIA